MKRLFLNNFWLKIIAIIAMTVAHVGVFLEFFLPGFAVNYDGLDFALQAIGKIAFPIFVFLLIEGLNHTSSKKKYFMRLGIMAGLMYLVELIINLPYFTTKFAIGGIERFGNIFMDLILIATTYCLITSENKKNRYYVAIPIAFIIGMMALKIYEAYTPGVLPLTYLYSGLYLQYDIFGILILLGYVFAYKLNDRVIKKTIKDTDLIEEFKQTPEYLWRKNCYASISIVIVSVVCYIIGVIGIPNLDYYCNFAILSYIALAAIFLLFYSGKLGPKNKYIQGAFYLYYPLHLVIIFLIFYFI